MNFLQFTVYLQHFSNQLWRGPAKAVPFFIEMTKLAETLKELVETEALKHGAFVVGHSTGAKGLLRYYVDSEGELFMNVISEISKNVSKQIDELDLGDEAFVFEVSSPGADNPLSDIRQFSKHLGRNFEVETISDKFEGKFIHIEGNNLQFETTITEKINGKKKVTTEIRNITFDQIKSAKIKISFNKT